MNPIYQLYRKLIEEEKSYFNIVGLLKDQEINNLDKYSKENFSSIYLFFDYDAHATKADDNKIKNLLSYFDNESEQGKLYISYPMAEALQHYRDMDSFKSLTVKCKRDNCPSSTCPDKAVCLNEPHYKNVVNNYNLNMASRHLDAKIWGELIKAHLCKMNYLVLDVFEIPCTIQSQMNIFNAQLRKYIQLPCPNVAVLSAFPIFLLDYYGCEGIKKKLAKM